MSDLTGPNAAYIKIISSDDHEFIIKRDVALTSGTIKAMLSGPGVFQENETNSIHFQEIPSHVLNKGKRNDAVFSVDIFSVHDSCQWLNVFI